MSVASVVVILSCLNCIVTSASDYFTEELLLKPLYSGQIYTHFHFTTIWDIDPDSETCKFNFCVVLILTLSVNIIL